MIFRFACLLAYTVLLLPLGCTGENSADGAIRVGMLPKLVGIPYFNACRTGAEEAARALGVDLRYDGPDTADSNKQVEIVNAWLAQGFEAIAVAPNNPEAIAPVLERAMQRGVRVITWDTDAVEGAREYFCNPVGYEPMARALVGIVAEELGGKGRVALISGTETAANQNTWIRLMQEILRKEYPGMSLVEPIEYPGEDDARAYQSAAGLLRRADRPDALVGMTSVSAPAAAKAVYDAGLRGKVVVTGITLPSAMRTYVKNGTVKKFVLWNPVDLGYLTVHVAKQLAEKQTPSGTLRAGRLGQLAVEGREINLGAPAVFSAENIDAFDF